MILPLRIEIDCVSGDVMLGTLIRGDHFIAGNIQFRANKHGYRAIRRFRKMGVDVEFAAFLKKSEAELATRSDNVEVRGKKSKKFRRR